MVKAGRSVVFDFNGALALARSMWALAGHVEDTRNARSQAAATALRQWRGRFADQFRQGAAADQANATNIADALRTDARLLATRWTDAMQQQGNVLYAEHKQRVIAQRSLWEQIGDTIFGDHTNYGPTPKRPAVPQPPNFAPTAALPRY